MSVPTPMRTLSELVKTCSTCGVSEGERHSEGCYQEGEVFVAWVASHCQRCGSPYASGYWATDELWDMLVGDPQKVLCISCLYILAKRQGMSFGVVPLRGSEAVESFRSLKADSILKKIRGV